MSSAPSDERDPSGRKRKFPKHLTEIYDVDHDNPLGSGSFSTVFRCRNRKTGQLLAIKQIDTRSGPEQSPFSPRNIAHEIAMMKLAGRHDNIMGCYAVQLEGPFVNIVVDIFPGGDLIDGFNTYQKAHGSLPDGQLAHITRQMVAAVAHVHSLHIVHRDVKGENFLCNLPDIGDPNCRIALADFGTAARLEPGDQMSGRAGTAAFWAPEVWIGEYDCLVDIWALGVTAFVLVAGSLPFQGEAEICRPGGPSFSLPSRASTASSQFIRACLAHDPRERLKAEEAARHPWLTAPPPPPATQTERRVKDSIRMGTSMCSCGLKILAGLFSCCCEALISGIEALASPPPPSKAEGGREAEKVLVEAIADSQHAASREPAPAVGTGL